MGYELALLWKNWYYCLFEKEKLSGNGNDKLGTKRIEDSDKKLWQETMNYIVFCFVFLHKS